MATVNGAKRAKNVAEKGREGGSHQPRDTWSPQSWKRREGPSLELIEGAQPRDPWVVSDACSPGQRTGYDTHLWFEATWFVAIAYCGNKSLIELSFFFFNINAMAC